MRKKNYSETDKKYLMKFIYHSTYGFYKIIKSQVLDNEGGEEEKDFDNQMRIFFENYIDRLIKLFGNKYFADSAHYHSRGITWSEWYDKKTQTYIIKKDRELEKKGKIKLPSYFVRFGVISSLEPKYSIYIHSSYASMITAYRTPNSVSPVPLLSG